MGRKFKKSSAPNIKKTRKKEDETILVLRSWHKSVVNIVYQLLSRKERIKKILWRG